MSTPTMNLLIAVPVVLFCSIPLILTIRRHSGSSFPFGFRMALIETLLATLAFVGLGVLCDWAARLWIG